MQLIDVYKIFLWLQPLNYITFVPSKGGDIAQLVEHRTENP